MWLSQSINCLVDKKSENIEKYASQYHKAQSDIFVLLFFFYQTKSLPLMLFMLLTLRKEQRL